MFNIADIVVVAIIALAGFLGYKKGFIKTGFGFVSFFAAVVITFMFYKPVMGIIKEHTGFEQWMTEYLYNVDLTGKDGNSNDDSEEESLKTGQDYIDNLPTEVVELIGLDEIKENAKNIVIQKIVEFAEKLLAIVIVYIVARIALLVVVLVLDLIAKLPILKQFNEILGLITGVILGLVRIYAIFIVITLLGSLPFTNGIVSIINSSLIASFLYNNNLLLRLLL